jgi:hypothetical protein
MPLFNIRLHVDAHVHQHESGSTLAVLDHLDQLERLMSKLSDKIAKIGTSLDKAIERVQDDVVTLQNKITALQEAVDNDTATPEDLAAIDMLEAKLAALDPVKPDGPRTPLFPQEDLPMKTLIVSLAVLLALAASAQAGGYGGNSFSSFQSSSYQLQQPVVQFQAPAVQYQVQTFAAPVYQAPAVQFAAPDCYGGACNQQQQFQSFRGGYGGGGGFSSSFRSSFRSGGGFSAPPVVVVQPRRSGPIRGAIRGFFRGF